MYKIVLDDTHSEELPEREKLISQLSASLGLGEDRLRRIFAQLPCTLKENLSLAQAERLKETLANLGVSSLIEGSEIQEDFCLSFENQESGVLAEQKEVVFGLSFETVKTEQNTTVESTESALSCDTDSILSPSLVEQKLLVGAGFKPALTNEEHSDVPSEPSFLEETVDNRHSDETQEETANQSEDQSPNFRNPFGPALKKNKTGSSDIGNQPALSTSALEVSCVSNGKKSISPKIVAASVMVSLVLLAGVCHYGMVNNSSSIADNKPDVKMLLAMQKEITPPANNNLEANKQIDKEIKKLTSEFSNPFIKGRITVTLEQNVPVAASIEFQAEAPQPLSAQQIVNKEHFLWLTKFEAEVEPEQYSQAAEHSATVPTQFKLSGIGRAYITDNGTRSRTLAPVSVILKLDNTPEQELAKAVNLSGEIVVIKDVKLEDTKDETLILRLDVQNSYQLAVRSKFALKNEPQIQ